MASGNTEEDGAYHDFTKECEFSTFTLIVEGKPLHILSHSLAPISPYFAKLCFDEKYNEMEKKEAPIPMEKFEDVHEMLQCLSPFYPQRPITAENACRMLHLADRFQIRSFNERILKFMASESFDAAERSDQYILNLIAAVDNIQLKNDQIMTKLITRFSAISYEDLKESGIFDAVSHRLSLVLMRAVSIAAGQNTQQPNSNEDLIFKGHVLTETSSTSGRCVYKKCRSTLYSCQNCPSKICMKCATGCAAILRLPQCPGCPSTPKQPEPIVDLELLQ